MSIVSSKHLHLNEFAWNLKKKISSNNANMGVPIIVLSSFSLFGFSQGTYFERFGGGKELVGEGKLLLYGKKYARHLCKIVGMKIS